MILTSFAMWLTPKKGYRYRQWVELTPQFYHNDGFYYEVKHFSADLLALSPTEKELHKPNYVDIKRQVLEAQDEMTTKADQSLFSEILNRCL